MKVVQETATWGATIVLVALVLFGSGPALGGVWRYTASLSQPMIVPAAATWGDYVYVTGGMTAAGERLDHVERARVLSDGSLGRWVLEPNALLEPLSHAAAVSANSRIYVAGGQTTTSGTVPTVQFASIGTDGSIGPWEATSSMLRPRENFALVEHGGYLYAIGGNPAKGTTSVEYAAINPDGTLGAWQVTASTLDGRWFGSAIASGGFVYSLGGYNGAHLSTVDYAPINPDGSLGEWQYASSMNVPRSGTPAVGIIDGYLYACGADDGPCSPHRTYERALVNPDGSLGSWVLQPDSLIVGYTNVAYAQVGSWLYLIAGADQSCAYSDDVQFLAPAAPVPGDADCSGIITISDAVYLINYIFAGGPAPGCR